MKLKKTFDAPFIIKEDKYSLSIIKNNNKKSKNPKRGISIFKKTLELNELNEDNIQMILQNTKKDDIINSYANIGFISITGLMCFAYCNEKDIKEIGIINFIKVYKINNIRYIILDSDMDQKSKNESLNFFKEYTKFEVNKGLIFTENFLNLDLSFDTVFHNFYDINKNIYHINPSINFCYNYDYLAYFRKFNLEDYITHIIRGYFNYSPKLLKNIFNIYLLIKDKELPKEIDYKENNEKIIKQIEIVLSSNYNYANQIFHIILYSYVGEFPKDIKLLYKILKKEQPKNKVDNGAILIMDIIDNIKLKNEKEKDILINKYKKIISEEFGDKNQILFIQKIENIQDFSDKKNNILDEIKYNYYLKDSYLEFETKQLLIISENEENLINIIDKILYRFKFTFLYQKEELTNKKELEINNYIRNFFINYCDFLKVKKKNASIIERLYSEPVNDDYLNKYVFKDKKKNEKNEKNNNTINDKNYNKANDYENNLNINQIIEKQKKNLELKKNEKGNTFSIYIITNNVACYSLENELELENLKKLLFPKEFQKRFSKDNFPTFYCIGLQEIVKLNTSNVIFLNNKNSVELWENSITQLLQKNYNYTLQIREDLVGILFLMFVKASEAKNISDIKKSITKAGFLQKMGNKGYISYEFKYKNKTFAFCTGHLTAGEKDKNIKNRANLLINILNHQDNNNSNKIYENDFYFLFGDMNFRVKIDHNQFLKEIEDMNDPNHKKVQDDSNIIKKTILREDEFCLNSNKEFNFRASLKNYFPREKQLNNSFDKDIKQKINEQKEDDPDFDFKSSLESKINEQQFKNIFLKKHLENEELNGLKGYLKNYQLEEHSINFLPTYKYIIGYNCYNVSKRIPSWTDRILFKKNRNIKCLCYNKIDVNYSDHKPVYALFEINLQDNKK